MPHGQIQRHGPATVTWYGTLTALDRSAINRAYPGSRATAHERPPTGYARRTWPKSHEPAAGNAAGCRCAADVG